MLTKPFARNRYSHGQLLTAEDLRDEQEYFVGKTRLHNRALHGAGVVYGLDAALEDQTLVVRPGLALDCMGREIVVCDSTQIELPNAREPIFIVIAYAERETGAVPVPGGPGAGGEPSTAPKRIEESYTLSWSESNPLARHSPRGQLWFACGREHALPLARLVPVDGGLTLDRQSGRGDKIRND